ncbi:MAG: hypothetical protein QOG46_427 [Pseudonocardiales bacterium]|jgi:hypothetical protein|nr:hypothetical protein [Pseudonocardiales bacterium]
MISAARLLVEQLVVPDAARTGQLWGAVQDLAQQQQRRVGVHTRSVPRMARNGPHGGG